MALVHPVYDVVALKIGPLSVHWYGLTYLVGFLLFVLLGRRRAKKLPSLGFNSSEIEDLLFYSVIGVILGGRLGYVLFYKFNDYIHNPLAIFKVWEGGMSFHGGFIGVLVAIAFYAYKTNRRFLEVTDFAAPMVPLGLASGRIGNYINGELWGRVSGANYSWLMRFPQAAGADQAYLNAHPESQGLAEQIGQYLLLPRHPSQLYQFALEGIALFVVLWLFASKIRPLGQVSALFLMGYGFFRFIAEFAREPDDFLGLLALNFSMGQWLSIPMVIVGLALWFKIEEACHLVLLVRYLRGALRQ